MKKSLLSIFMLGTIINSAYAADNTGNTGLPERTIKGTMGYTIGQYFTLVNDTDVPLHLNIPIPNETAEISQIIPAHSKSKPIYFENNNHFGLVGPSLFTAITTPFYIRDASGKQVYAKGSIVFHVKSIFSRYSYLNRVTAAPDWTVVPTYTCNYEGKDSFNNIITIKKGNPDKTIDGSKPDTSDLSCGSGIASSSLDESKSNYTVTCTDNTVSGFERQSTNLTPTHAVYEWHKKTGEHENAWQIDADVWDKAFGYYDVPHTKDLLNQSIGQAYCADHEYKKPNPNDS